MGVVPLRGKPASARGGYAQGRTAGDQAGPRSFGPEREGRPRARPDGARRDLDRCAQAPGGRRLRRRRGGHGTGGRGLPSAEAAAGGPTPAWSGSACRMRVVAGRQGAGCRAGERAGRTRSRFPVGHGHEVRCRSRSASRCVPSDQQASCGPRTCGPSGCGCGPDGPWGDGLRGGRLEAEPDAAPVWRPVTEQRAGEDHDIQVCTCRNGCDPCPDRHGGFGRLWGRQRGLRPCPHFRPRRLGHRRPDQRVGARHVGWSRGFRNDGRRRGLLGTRQDGPGHDG